MEAKNAKIAKKPVYYSIYWSCHPATTATQDTIGVVSTKNYSHTIENFKAAPTYMRHSVLMHIVHTIYTERETYHIVMYGQSSKIIKTALTEKPLSD